MYSGIRTGTAFQLCRICAPFIVLYDRNFWYVENVVIMAALCNRAGHYIFALWFLLSSIYLFFPHLISAVTDSQTWCARLAGNAGPKKSTSRHCRTTLSGYIFATKACIDNRKKLVKQQYLLHMSPQYGELRSTSG